MDGLTVGRIVHHRLSDGCQPGIVVRVHGPNGVVNLTVFNDDPLSCPDWEESVVYSAEATPDTWHWSHECPDSLGVGA